MMMTLEFGIGNDDGLEITWLLVGHCYKEGRVRNGDVGGEEGEEPKLTKPS